MGGRDMGNCPASDEARFDSKEYARGLKEMNDSMMEL
jgi:hypothetical protein